MTGSSPSGASPADLSLQAENERLRAELEHARMVVAYSQLVFENSLDAILVTDDHGCFLDVNQAAMDMFGYSREVFFKMRVGDIPTWESETAAADQFGEYVSKGWAVGEFRFIDAQGRKRVALYSAQQIGPNRHRSILRDLTAQRERDEQLRLLTKAVQNANDAIIITEADQIEEPGPRILYVNESFERMTGYLREEVLGKTPRILQGAKTERAMLDRIRAALKDWQPVRVEVVNYRKDGSEFIVDLSLFPIAGEPGNQSYWMAVQRDVTEQRQAERRILESLKLKDMLLREIHHRIKNNLQLVSSVLELQMSHHANRDMVASFVKESQDRIRAMALVHEHLYESDNPESVAMDEFILTLVEHLRGTFQTAGIECRTNCDRVLVPMDMAIPFGLILNELVTNAIKHAFPGDEKGHVVVRFTVNGREILVEVEDNGIGLPEEVSVGKQKSLGLGLVRLLVQQIKGTVGFEQTVPGTRANVRAPLPASITAQNIRGMS